MYKKQYLHDIGYFTIVGLEPYVKHDQYIENRVDPGKGTFIGAAFFGLFSLHWCKKCGLFHQENIKNILKYALL